MTPGRIDTPEALKAARKAMGLTVGELADRLRLAPPNGADTVRAWESGKRAITGPVQVAMELMAREADPKFVRVPREPTFEMLQAGWRVPVHAADPLGDQYCAMIEARP